MGGLPKHDVKVATGLRSVEKKKMRGTEPWDSSDADVNSKSQTRRIQREGQRELRADYLLSDWDVSRAHSDTASAWQDTIPVQRVVCAAAAALTASGESCSCPTRELSTRGTMFRGSLRRPVQFLPKPLSPSGHRITLRHLYIYRESSNAEVWLDGWSSHLPKHVTWILHDRQLYNGCVRFKLS